MKKPVLVTIFETIPLFVGLAFFFLFISDIYNNIKFSIHSFDMWAGPIFFGVIGVMFVLIGSLLVKNMLYPLYNKYNAKNYTKLIRANVKDVYLDKSMNFSSKQNPYIIEAIWKSPKTEKEYLFYSYGIWADITDIVKVEDPIIIKVHPKNYKKYIMEVDFIEKKLNRSLKKGA